ncbi:gluconate:H+ symporter [Priestia megaterium]|uniref:gluconate:H+ symporter n=1 Tax=Priestia megaterium TaxID=1404 RepID=UPI0036725675
MAILIVALGVLLLLFLMMKLKLNTFVSLIIVSILVGLMEGIPLPKVISSIETGIGGTLGHLALIFGLGAMLGKLVADAGGAYRIATTLINKFGRKKIQTAVVIASFIVGIALFMEVGIVLLLPIIYAISCELGISILYLGIPMMAALSVTHGFLPPHPAPTAITGAYGANIGLVLLYGMIIGIPTAIIAGPVFNNLVRKFAPSLYERQGNIAALGEQKTFKLEETPSFGISTLTALFPVILMALSTIITMAIPGKSLITDIIEFVGNPSTALLISVILAIFTMGLWRGNKVDSIMKSMSDSIGQIAMMLLIIGGGGAFKQVLIDSGVGDYIAKLMGGYEISPIVLAWLIAAALRICLGSATVAALTTAGLILPMISGTSVEPALIVLATGAGSLIASHVNDVGFWMFKEYFNLSIKETFCTWTILETLISVIGLLGALALSLVV